MRSSNVKAQDAQDGASGQRRQKSGAMASIVREFDTLREFFTSATLIAVVDLPFIFFFIWVINLIAGPLALVPLIAVPVVAVAVVVIVAASVFAIVVVIVVVIVAVVVVAVVITVAAVAVIIFVVADVVATAVAAVAAVGLRLSDALSDRGGTMRGNRAYV